MRPRPRSALRLAPLLCAWLAACGSSAAGPEEPRAVLRALGDSVIFISGAAGASEQIAVAAFDEATGSALAGVQVRWQIVEGGASLSPPQSQTSFSGVATTTLTPAQAGTHRVRASTARQAGPSPVIVARVVDAPVIAAIQPASAAAGSEITITGTGFSATAAHNTVWFSGVRGDVLSATPTQLRVRVPSCLPTRTVTVTAGLGAVVSAGRSLSTTGGAGASLDLQPGEVRTLADSASLGCVRLPQASAGALYLITVHNAARLVAPPLDFELRAFLPNLAAQPPLQLPRAAPQPFAESWEALLRERERALPREPFGTDPVTLRTGPSFQAVPAPGQEREFTVLNAQQQFDRVRAVARRVSERAVVWVDVEAADAFSAEDLAFFTDLFDATIYPTNVGVFGEPSDVDGNGRIYILFTPKVNALTPRNESSFITGYFYGCDLLPRRRCSGSNEAEVFFSLVPDPQGRWSSPRTHQAVRAAVPPILAHEFQHMIHFARRGFSTDVLWLSEALAHTAEELVGQALQAAQPDLARTFATPNLSRAQRYLQAPRTVGVLAESGPGSVEMRGGAWLLLRHARAQYGGNELLTRLSGTTLSGVPSLVQHTGQPWERLITDFGIAVWADGAPELQGELAPRYRFGGFDLRAALAALPGGYPLRPASMAWNDFAVAGSIASGSQDYFLVAAPQAGTGAPLNFVLAGRRGAPIPDAAPALLSVLRVR